MRPTKAIEIVLSVYAAGMFVVLWAGAAWAALVDPSILDEAWAWLSGLPTLPAILVWILGLPIAIGLWASQADLGIVLSLVIVAGLVVWTVPAVAGLFRAFRPAR